MTHANHETIASIPDSGGGRRPSYGAIEFPVKTTTEAILNMPVMETTASSSSIPSLIPETPAPDSMTRIVERLRGIPCAGLVLAMMSGIFFATAGFIVKLIPDVNPIEIVISRSVIQMCVYLPVILINRMPMFGVKGERLPLFCRGFFGFLSFTLCYVAYRMIPLADASTIVFSAPVYVSIFACLFLKEECGVFQTTIVAVTIGGVLLISKPSFLFGEQHEAVVQTALRMEGTVLALVSSLCAALTFVLIRRLQKTPAAVVINCFSLVSITCGLMSLLVIRHLFQEEAGDLATGVGIPATAGEIGWLIGNGVCGVLGQLCLTVALKIEEASLVSLARTIDIVMAFVFQVIWLPSEAVHWTSLLGAAIVCLGVCVSAMRRWLKDKEGKFETLWLVINCGFERPVKEKADVSHAVERRSNGSSLSSINDLPIKVPISRTQSSSASSLRTKAGF